MLVAVEYKPMLICVDFIECCRELLAGGIAGFRNINDHVKKWLLVLGVLLGRLDLMASTTVSKCVVGKPLKADIGAAAAKWRISHSADIGYPACAGAAFLRRCGKLFRDTGRIPTAALQRCSSQRFPAFRLLLVEWALEAWTELSSAHTVSSY